MRHKDKNRWNFIDKFIAKFRYKQVDKYVLRDNSIVDIGCGQEGTFLLKHKDIISTGYGFDYKIQNHSIDNITFINNKNINKLPLENESIDLVFLNAVLEHLTEPEKILSDCFRIVKKEGMVIITTPTPISKPLLEFLAFKLHIINEEEIKEHVHYYSRKDIDDLILKLSESYKLEIIKYKRFEFGFNSLIVIKKL